MRYRGVDFGFINPTAVVSIAIDPKGIIYVYDVLYEKGLSTPNLAQLMAQRAINQHFMMTLGDSASASDISELNTYGIPITAVEKSSGEKDVDWLTYRVRKITERLLNGTIKIFSNCEPLIFEFENYQYKEVQEGGIIVEKPMKMNDHALDALSYIVVNIPEYIEKTYNTTPYIPYNPRKWNVG